MLLLVLAEAALALRSESLDLRRCLFLRLLQTSVLALASLGDLKMNHERTNERELITIVCVCVCMNGGHNKTHITFSAARFSAVSSCWMPCV